MEFAISKQLGANCRKTPDLKDWLAQLPSVVRQLARRWSLEIGAPFDGDEVSCSWVAPCALADGTTAVLKVGMPHFEGEREIEGLRFWNGDPTVQLLEADDALGAMLLEFCNPGLALRTLPESEQDIVIAQLLRRLWRVPTGSGRFHHLSMMTALWNEETLAQAEHWPDRVLVAEGLEVFKELSAPASGEVLLATDLHAGNVLRAKREPWLVIDPKPFLGDPAYDVTQHLFNCRDRLRADAVGTVDRLAGLLGLNSKRVRLWTFARAAAEPREHWKSDWTLELARSTAPG